jgi:hypothetical protein
MICACYDTGDRTETDRGATFNASHHSPMLAGDPFGAWPRLVQRF